MAAWLFFFFFTFTLFFLLLILNFWVLSITFPLQGLECVFLLQVFKVLVRKPPDESWVVFRRYTDFSRLNDKVCFSVFSLFWNVSLLCGRNRSSEICDLSEALACDDLFIFADTVTINLLLLACLPFSALWKWLGLHKEALCYQTATRPEPTKGTGLSWFWELQSRN